MDDPKKAILKEAVMKNSPGTKMFICRHGNTMLNGAGDSVERIRGWVDIPLDKQGLAEAAQTGKALKGSGVKKIYSSDLGRAVKTAEAIAKNTGAKITKTPYLRPWNLGDWQGKPVKEILAAMKDHQAHPNKKVPGGESFNTFQDRYIGFLKEKMEEAKKVGPIALATHFRNLGLTRAWLATGADNDRVDLKQLGKTDLGTGDIFEMDYDPKIKKWKGRVKPT